MEYDIKRGWFKNIEGDLLEQMMAQVFGNVKKEGDLLVSTYGVLDRIEVKILAKKRTSSDQADQGGYPEYGDNDYSGGGYGAPAFGPNDFTEIKDDNGDLPF